MKATIIFVYLSVIRGATERKSNQGIMTEIRIGITHYDDDELIFIREILMHMLELLENKN